MNGLINRAYDLKTNAFMRVESTPEIDVRKVFVRLESGEEFTFFIMYKPKAAESGQSNPNIKLLISSFQNIARAYGGTLESNTELVRYLIDGLAAINRRWPLFKNSQFYSNLNEYREKGIPIPEFDFPSDEELARL